MNKMARLRKPVNAGEHTASQRTRGNSHSKEREPQSSMPTWCLVFTASVCLIAGYLGYLGYLETRVNSPFGKEKVVRKSGLEVPERYWGTYRPGVYFGMKTRQPYSPVFGLMWYFPRHVQAGTAGIRHWCEQGDNLKRYSWMEHDGRNFGIQEIEDGPFLITTSFVKRLGGAHGGDWTARITVETNGSEVAGEKVSLLFYTAIEEKTKGWIKPSVGSKYITGVTGQSNGLGIFTLRFFNRSSILHESYLSTVAQGLHVLKETVMSSLRVMSDKKTKKQFISLPGEVFGGHDKDREPNFVITQVTAQVPFTMDVAFESASFRDLPGALVGETYEWELERHRRNFNLKFEEVFHLKEKGFDEEKIKFAKAALSNLIGGIGYFYGSSQVQSQHTKGPVPYWKAPLYTAVPSRSFFPRGFLWDEGFHGLLISVWDLEIELDIMGHWFDLMNVEGWIPREQILGVEAESKVPGEFIVQRNSNANPPTFFLTLHFIINKVIHQLSEEHYQFLHRLFPRIQAWFHWFNHTQVGDLPSTYRWRGRDAETNRELNPKTLTSGLDDFPRATHPSIQERHLDLRCWIALASVTMTEVAKLLVINGLKYANTFYHLTDNTLLDEVHWSREGEMYADYGLHTDEVALKRPPSRPPAPGHPAPKLEMVRVTSREPHLQYVNSFGYVSLFPFLLQVVNSNSVKLGKILEDIRNPNLIWTKYGLRSLSKSSPFYMKRNTEHDPPYWRGQIWININYLAVRALHHYGTVEGPYKETAFKIYQELRENLINNIFKEYKRTGYLWEQYSDKTGEGMGCRPFTGWSSLVVLLMAEIF